MHSNLTLLEELNDEMATVLLPAIIYLAVLMVVGSVGNLLTIFIFGWRLNPTAQNCLFMWLGVLDLMSCTIGMPSEIVDLQRYLLYEDATACKIFRFLSTVGTVASSNLLLVIAVDRYRRVCKPLHSQMELVHARMGVGVAVGVAVVLAIPALALYGHRTVDTSVEGLKGCDCSVQDQYIGRLHPLLYELQFGTLFIIYTAILAVVYARVWLETRRHRRYMETHVIPPMTYSSLLNLNDCSEDLDHGRNEARGSVVAALKIRKSLKANKLTVIAFAVTAVFVLSFLPHLVLIFLRTVIQGFDHQQTGADLVLYNIFLRSFFVNSVANVFVYGAMNDDFRDQCRELCSCVKRSGGSARVRRREGADEAV